VPTVSLCIPTYNRKDYLKQTLDSVFAQTYKDFEVFIVDDGSTDGTEEMIRNSGYNVRYYWQKNNGDAAARNKLIELANGKYIAFLDSDDLYFPDSLQRLVTAIQNDQSKSVVYGPYLAIDEIGNISARKRKDLPSGFITEYLFQEIIVHTSGSMFSKTILKEEGGFDESLPICSDYDLCLRLSLKYRFIGLPQPTFKRRRHKGNLSSYNMANRLTELQVLERFYYENDGKALLESVAMRRLSKENYRVGKCALREGLTEQACKYLSQSFQKHPNIKSLIYWTKAAIARKLK